MVSFENDYVAGAHPRILQRLLETNMEPLPGYGTDLYCERAREKIRAACGCPEAGVEFFTGGTQANAVIISSMLNDYEGVIAASTGHISVHEAGAIEFTGHKVLEIPHREGKIEPARLKAYLEDFYADKNHAHMVFPGMVYISHPTEYGTIYTKNELEELSGICRSFGIPLYLDGARLGYGLMSRQSDLELADIARYCDVFYIGGTKAGALCGEAAVFCGHAKPAHFLTSVKKRGALCAKGRLLGIQFDTLFTDNLYFELARHAIDMSEKLKQIFHESGIPFYLESPTNQQFLILEHAQAEKLEKQVTFSFWEAYGQNRSVVRFAASWSTTEDDLRVLKAALEALKPDAERMSDKFTQ